MLFLETKSRNTQLGAFWLFEVLSIVIYPFWCFKSIFRGTWVGKIVNEIKNKAKGIRLKET